MPTLSKFFGIRISIRTREANHPMPHYHARYGEFTISIEIATGAVLSGYLPTRAIAMVREWHALHSEELLAAWEAARDGRAPEKIDPLD